MDTEERVLAKRVGAAIRRHRRARGWSQEQLAERASLSLDHIGLLERGARLPSMLALVRLVRLVGASVDEMIGLDAADPWTSDLLRAAATVRVDDRRAVLAMVRAVGVLATEEAPRGGGGDLVS